MKKITKKELKNSYQDFMTVGKLKEFLAEHNVPDDAKVLIQRVEDVYYEEHNWDVYLKEDEHWHNADQWNKDIDSGKYLDKTQYPNIEEKHLIKYSEEHLEEMKAQYHPAWCCVGYKDDIKDFLFIDLHY